MKQLIATLVSWGPLGVFLAALLDGAGVPVPGGVDVLLIFLGSQLPEQFLLLAILGVAGSVIGNFFLYAVARKGGKMFLEKRERSRRSHRFRAWFDRYGLLTVFVSALVPLPVMPMKFFVLCAGALNASASRFLIVFAGARIPRYLGLVLLGRAMGDDALGYLRSHVLHLVSFAVCLFVVLMILIRVADQRRPAVMSPK